MRKIRNWKFTEDNSRNGESRWATWTEYSTYYNFSCTLKSVVRYDSRVVEFKLDIRCKPDSFHPSSSKTFFSRC